MVLTNFECWANGGGAEFDLGGTAARRQPPLDMFNPRAVQALGPAPGAAVSHISSNGYYGFSYVSAAHDNNNNNNNNNTVAHNHNMAAAAENDVNGFILRCKKRFYPTNDDDFSLLNSGGGEAVRDVAASSAPAKRCRFDDDFAAQYCNDFFALPSTQIGTQSCLMDTEDFGSQPQQQQVDAAMMATTQPNSINSQSNSQPPSTQAQEPQQQQSHPPLYQHYQGHHRANRDVSRYDDDSRCNFSPRSTLESQNIKNLHFNANDLAPVSEKLGKMQPRLSSVCEQQSFVVVTTGDDDATATMFATTHGGSAYHFLANDNFFEDI